MLTLKICSPGGRELILEAASFEHFPETNMIRIGTDSQIELPPKSLAFVMNSSGKTISRYEHLEIVKPQ